MTKTFCDLCGNECSNFLFKIPVAATFVNGEPHDMMPINMNLCNECRSKLYKTVESIASKDELKQFNKRALDRKMHNDDSWEF